MNQVAIIGPTASGKSDLAIEVALKHNAYILSIDSLAIYKEADIVSAKPSKEELSIVPHFGIDELYIDEYFSVEIFLELYEDVKKRCETDGKNLVIVGGTSFYLKRLLEGLSPAPKVSIEVMQKVHKMLQDLKKAYAYLYEIDSDYMRKIAPNDRYRIEKALLIYEASKKSPSEWFMLHPPKPIIKDLDLYEIAVDRELLRQRITQRTKKMLQNGLIDEVCFLEQKYTQEPNPMKAIGIVETLEYLNGRLTKEELQEQIIIHTAQLAKRQQTFNKNQFTKKISKPLQELSKLLLQ
ncbi:tRNA dimethylallyltransferase [hydrothermal vent metagenome]|uniref:tRNA dimethylallyltransferase n=1 Tax=hydrothermal vent metagenome TaxID=652676 RepID=A0A1W1C5K3_9ZZZZ